MSMKIILKAMLVLATAISMQVSAALPQLDVQVSVENQANGDVNATLTITNNLLPSTVAVKSLTLPMCTPISPIKFICVMRFGVPMSWVLIHVPVLPCCQTKFADSLQMNRR